MRNNCCFYLGSFTSFTAYIALSQGVVKCDESPNCNPKMMALLGNLGLYLSTAVPLVYRTLSHHAIRAIRKSSIGYFIGDLGIVVYLASKKILELNPLMLGVMVGVSATCSMLRLAELFDLTSNIRVHNDNITAANNDNITAANIV